MKSKPFVGLGLQTRLLQNPASGVIHCDKLPVRPHTRRGVVCEDGKDEPKPETNKSFLGKKAQPKPCRKPL